MRIATDNYVKSIVAGITNNMTLVRATMNGINYRPSSKKAGKYFLGDE